LSDAFTFEAWRMDFAAGRTPFISPLLAQIMTNRHYPDLQSFAKACPSLPTLMSMCKQVAWFAEDSNLFLFIFLEEIEKNFIQSAC
jgi:hypothetical protein